MTPASSTRSSQVCFAFFFLPLGALPSTLDVRVAAFSSRRLSGCPVSGKGTPGAGGAAAAPAATGPPVAAAAPAAGGGGGVASVEAPSASGGGGPAPPA